MKLHTLILLIVLFFIANTVAYSDDTYDIVHLKDSTIIKGTIIETIPNKSITIKSFDGIIQTIDFDQIVKIKKENISDINLRDSSYLELGINLGTPAGVNLAAGFWFGSVGFRVSGMQLSKMSGIQLNFSYKISDSPNFLHSIGFAGGTSEIETGEYDDYDEYDNLEIKKWQYIGLVYNLNWGGFFLEGGLSIGEGDFTSPQAIFQIGYMYRAF